MNKATVKAALESALANGYTFEDWTALQIAEDLIRCDADFASADPIALSNLVSEVCQELDI